jgi:hypothetical protein
MWVRPVDQDASSPNQSPLEHQRHLPNRSQEQRRRIQLPAARPGDGTWTEIGNKSARVSGPLELDTTMALATGCFIFLYRMFKGKLRQESVEYTHS